MICEVSSTVVPEKIKSALELCLTGVKFLENNWHARPKCRSVESVQSLSCRIHFIRNCMMTNNKMCILEHISEIRKLNISASIRAPSKSTPEVKESVKRTKQSITVHLVTIENYYRSLQFTPK